VRDSTNGGDGFATLGEIDAPGSDLGIVKIDGDLGRISAGNSATALPAVQRLTVQSLSRFGTSTGAADLHSVITKSVSSLAVRGDVVGAFVDVAGGIGSISVGGSLLGGSATNSGEISASGAIGKVSIGGDVVGGSGQFSGELFAGGVLTGVKIGGSVRGGSGTESGLIFGNGGVGTLLVGGDVIGGNFPSLPLFSGFIGGKRIASVTINGSLIAGINTNFTLAQTNGAIRVDDDLGRVTIKGSMVGTPSGPAVISARGQATPLPTKDVAISSLTIGGRIENARILAGYDVLGNARNADAQIGRVSVGGDWIAATMTAGGSIGMDGTFGTSDDAKAAGAGVKDDSQAFSGIGSIKIGGQAMGTVPGGDGFGITAESIGTVKVGGLSLPLHKGNANDVLALGPTGDFNLRELTH
jgi:hypothetical protein